MKINEELAVLCAKVQYKNNCDNEVWELVNSLYGSEKADDVVRYMNAACEYNNEYNVCCMDHCKVIEPLSYKLKETK